MTDVQLSRRPRADASGFEFVVGQNASGMWLVVETHGKGGGLFSSRDAAVRYAAHESCRPFGEILVSADPVDLTL